MVTGDIPVGRYWHVKVCAKSF